MYEAFGAEKLRFASRVTEGRFEDAAQEGSVNPLRNFLEIHAAGSTTKVEMVDYCVTVVHRGVIRDAEGVFGVDVPTVPSGATHMYRRVSSSMAE